MITSTFSYHTLLLQKQLLTHSECICVLDALHEYKEYRYGKGTVTYRLNIPGCRFLTRYTDSYHAVLEIIVNPMRLLQSPSFKTLFDPSKGSFWNVAVEFDAILRDLKIPLTFQDFTLQRLDLCADFSFDSPNEVDIYMKVIKKAKIPLYYERDRFPDTMENSDGKNQHSFRIKSTGSMFTVYDKDYQMFDQKLQALDTDAKNVLRFELELKRKTLRAIEKAYDIHSTVELLDRITAEGICEKYLSDFIDHLFPQGAYCSYANAKTRVEEGLHGEKKRALCMDILRYATKCETMDDVIQLLYKKCISLGRIERCLGYFEALGIQPITIPEAYLPQRDKAFCLPGIPELFHQAMQKHIHADIGNDRAPLIS